MSRVEIDAGGRKVVIDHDGELAHLAETASKLWTETAGVEPARLGGGMGFATAQRTEAPPVANGPYRGTGRPRITGEVSGDVQDD